MEQFARHVFILFKDIQDIENYANWAHTLSSHLKLQNHHHALVTVSLHTEPDTDWRDPIVLWSWHNPT